MSVESSGKTMTPGEDTADEVKAMQKFCFVVTDSYGISRAGTVMAEDMDEVVEVLRKSSLVVKDIWQPVSVSIENADPNAMTEEMPQASLHTAFRDSMRISVMTSFIHIIRGFFRWILPSLQG